jgi:hypothetical protein
VFFIIEFRELIIVLFDKVKKSIKSEVKLFREANFFPVAQIHAVIVSFGDRNIK